MRFSIRAAIVLSVCVGAAAPAFSTADSQPSGPIQVAGRWHSDRVWDMSRRATDCKDGKCGLTLDVVACGDSWCGIQVGENGACGLAALKLDAGKAASSGGMLFSGNLQLAGGTEPYIVEAYLQPPAGTAPMMLSMTGDTGGELKMFRRSFPFHATLARTGEATCGLEKPVS